MNVTLSPLKDVISPKVLVRQENSLMIFREQFQNNVLESQRSNIHTREPENYRSGVTSLVDKWAEMI
jgi:hypothetical protein